MIHYLRTNNNKNIVDTDLYGTIDDLKISSNIFAVGYGRAVLDMEEDLVDDFMKDVHFLNEFRGYYFEILRYKKDIETKEDVENILKEKYETIANKYNLKYVTD